MERKKIEVTKQQMEKFFETMKAVGDNLIRLAEPLRQLFEALDSSFGFTAYQRAGYRYGKSIRGYKKWRKQQFGV